MIISVFTPHGGCPERCNFCDQKVSGGDPTSVQNVTRTIEDHLATSKNGFAEEIAFYGGTFTAFSKQRQLDYLDACKPWLDTGKIGAVRISTRPDCIDQDWMQFLHDKYSLRTVELGVQSADPSVLKTLGRTHTVLDAMQATVTLKKIGITVSHHYMIGCPGESEVNDPMIVEFCKSSRPDLVRIHPMVVIKGTAFEQAYLEGKLKVLSLDEAVLRASWLVQKLEDLKIKVIRLGLQANDLLNESVVAGPWHPSFGDLVKRRVTDERQSWLHHTAGIA